MTEHPADVDFENRGASLPEDLKNYWPVSGLSFLSKLVECVVADQMRSHIDLINLGNTFQSAYKDGH